MGEENINNDRRSTVFVDLDGVVVIHNYNPVSTKDELISGAAAALVLLKNTHNCFMVLTTSRKEEHCLNVLNELKAMGFEFDKHLFEMPTGPRIIINDYKHIDQLKALSYNIERNKAEALFSAVKVMYP
jgi:hypothetical protein